MSKIGLSSLYLELLNFSRSPTVPDKSEPIARADYNRFGKKICAIDTIAV
ncbi:MAG: hypothetical protein GDA56_18805 [Hormoscilla sp. GM7CHS1pb]|nr:hypothetical protein [Hormoscilla sp. GM7CHS1pb]